MPVRKTSRKKPKSRVSKTSRKKIPLKKTSNNRTKSIPKYKKKVFYKQIKKPLYQKTIYKTIYTPQKNPVYKSE